MYSPYNRNNCSLFWIPECIWNPNYLGDQDLAVWSCHLWNRDKYWMPKYQVLIRYNFIRDPRGLYRAQVKNIWDRSDRLEVYCKEEKLEGSELKEAKAEIKERQERLFGYSDIYDNWIRRYKFNYIATLPQGNIAGLHGHHKVEDNPRMRKLAAAYGRELPDSWLRATNDQFVNISPESDVQHRLGHVARGDSGYFTFKANSIETRNPNVLRS